MTGRRRPGTEFCPDEYVKRSQMATFLRNLPEARVVDADEGSYGVLTVKNSSPGEVGIGLTSTVSTRPFRCVTGPVG